MNDHDTALRLRIGRVADDADDFGSARGFECVAKGVHIRADHRQARSLVDASEVRRTGVRRICVRSSLGQECECFPTIRVECVSGVTQESCRWQCRWSAVGESAVGAFAVGAFAVGAFAVG